MKQFMDKDFLLSTDAARDLFHNYAEKMPVVDYHCHINPQEIYEDRKFDNITQVWLGAVFKFHSTGKRIRDTESRRKSKRRMVTVIFYIHRELIVVDIDIPQNGIFAFHFGTLPEIDHMAYALVLIKSIRSDRSLQPLVPAFRPVSV